MKPLKAPLDEPKVKIPQALRLRVKDFKQAVPVILIESGVLVCRIKGTLGAHYPWRGIIHQDLTDGHIGLMDHWDLQHLDAVSGKDVAAVAVTLLLITLAGLQ